MARNKTSDIKSQSSGNPRFKDRERLKVLLGQVFWGKKKEKKERKRKKPAKMLFQGRN